MSRESDDTPISHGTVRVNDIEMHYAEAGDGPLVVLLHGFPEFWYAWREHIPLLADRGYHVVAPDLRGYNETEGPERVSAYDVDTLATDVAELIAEFGDEATVVGHDWGGIVGWHLTAQRPASVSRLVTINAPHPAASARELRKPSNLPSSWYFFVYQLPALPELLMRAGDFALMESAFRDDTTTDEAFTDEEIARYKEMMAEPDLMTRAINYDRALFRRTLGRAVERYLPTADDPDPMARIETPTLVLWGEQDRYYHLGLLDGLDQWVADLDVRRYADASHWLPAEYPERVVREVDSFAD